jgi:small subunit ribosomal protein S18
MKERKFFKKYCKYTASKITYLDYKDPIMMRISLSERFKIMPRRLTGTSKRAQELVTLSIKRARHMAFIPYTTSAKGPASSSFELPRH